jgi:hypothetical protein
LDASGFFTPVTKFRTLRQAGFGQAILDFVGRLSIGPFFVDLAPPWSKHHEPPTLPESEHHYTAAHGRKY